MCRHTSRTVTSPAPVFPESRRKFIPCLELRQIHFTRRRRLGGLGETIGETAEQYPRDDADRRSCTVYERNPPLDVLLQDAPFEIEHPDVDGWRNEQEQPPASDDETGGHTEKSHHEQVDDAWS
jgi:hypothetical protein